MANGLVDLFIPGDMTRIRLIDAIAATDDGQWISTKGYDQASIQVDGITTATVRINASNQPTQPANSSHEIERTNVTVDSEITYAVLPMWIKARISAWTSGTISVFITLRRSGGKR